MKVTKYFLGLTCTTTDINNGKRNRFATAPKFGPLDPIVTFFHSHDVIYQCNCYFRVQNHFFSVKIKMWSQLLSWQRAQENMCVDGSEATIQLRGALKKRGFFGQKRASQALATACDRLRRSAYDLGCALGPQ